MNAEGWGTHAGADWTWLVLVFLLISSMVAAVVVAKLRDHR